MFRRHCEATKKLELKPRIAQHQKAISFCSIKFYPHQNLTICNRHATLGNGSLSELTEKLVLSGRHDGLKNFPRNLALGFTHYLM